MKRRTFLAGVVTVASLPRSLAAQTAPKVVRIGWLTAQQASSLTPYLEALRAALAELGYVEGRNLTIEFRFGDDEIERVPALAAELVQLPVDLIVAQGAAAFEVHKLALPIPVVFSMSADPVSAGFVDSLTRPRGNMTGVTLMAMELSGKRLALLRDIAPAVRRVAVVGNPEHPGAHLERAYSEERGRQLDLVIDYVPTPTRDVLTKAFATMSANPPQAISVLPDGFAVQNRRSIIDFATSLHVPVISGWPVFARCAVHLRAARYRVLPALGLLCRSHPQGRQARRNRSQAADVASQRTRAWSIPDRLTSALGDDDAHRPHPTGFGRNRLCASAAGPEGRQLPERPESGGFCAPMRRDARCPSSRMQSASYCLEGAAKAEELALPATQLGQWVRTGVPSSSSISVVEWLTP